MWFKKKKEDNGEDLRELWTLLRQNEMKLDMLETNFRIFTKKFNTKIGKLPTETNQKETKDIYNEMFCS